MLWAALLMVSAAVSAQTNPVDGFIITNEGDTIHGTLDYLASRKNSEECHFKKEGESEFLVYKPGEIKGYRFLSDGVYYVTKTFTMDETPTTFFAEYLLKGGVNLYRYNQNGYELFFFENENGDLASISSNDVYGRPGESNHMNKALGPTFLIFQKSQKAKDALVKSNLTAHELTKITRDYDMEYCQEGGDCVQFQYDAAKTKRSKTHIMATLGAEMLQCSEHDQTKWAVSPTVGVGLYTTFPRMNKHLALEAQVTFSYFTYSYGKLDYKDIVMYRKVDIDDHKAKWSVISVPIMLNYLFKEGNVLTPYVAVGINNTFAFSKESLKYYDGRYCAFLRPSIGLGVNIPVGDHTFRIGAAFSSKCLVKSNSCSEGVEQNCIAKLTAGYIF